MRFYNVYGAINTAFCYVVGVWYIKSYLQSVGCEQIYMFGLIPKPQKQWPFKYIKVPIWETKQQNKVAINIQNIYQLHKECVGKILCSRSSLSCEPVSLRVAIVTSSDTVCSHNRRYLIKVHVLYQHRLFFH